MYNYNYNQWSRNAQFICLPKRTNYNSIQKLPMIFYLHEITILIIYSTPKLQAGKSPLHDFA